MKYSVTLFFIFITLPQILIGQVDGNHKYIRDCDFPEYIIDQPSQIESFYQKKYLYLPEKNKKIFSHIAPITIGAAVEMYLKYHTYDEFVKFISHKQNNTLPYSNYFFSIRNIDNMRIRTEQILYDIVYDKQLYPYTFTRNRVFYVIAYEPLDVRDSGDIFSFLYKYTPNRGWVKATNKPISFDKSYDKNSLLEYKSIYLSTLKLKPSLNYYKKEFTELNYDISINTYNDYSKTKNFNYNKFIGLVTKIKQNQSSYYFDRKSTFTHKISNDLFVIALEKINYRRDYNDPNDGIGSSNVYSELITITFDDDNIIIDNVNVEIDSDWFYVKKTDEQPITNSIYYIELVTKNNGNNKYHTIKITN